MALTNQRRRTQDELAQRMAEYYRQNDAYHQSVAEIGGERPGPEERALFQAIAGNLRGQSQALRVLEIGCGRAESAKSLMETVCGGQYVGIEPSVVAVQHAMAEHGSYHFLVGDGTNLPIGDESFDVCVFSWVLEHAAFPDKMLREAIRILRPNGLLALIAPVSDLPWLIPGSLRHRATSPGFVLQTLAGRWVEALRIRYFSHYFAFRTIDDPFALRVGRKGLSQPDDDQVYWGSSMEILKYLRIGGCEVRSIAGRAIRSYVVNGRRPVLDLARRLLFLAFRASLGRLNWADYTTTVSIVAQKTAEGR